jgi:ribonuclease HII
MYPTKLMIGVDEAGYGPSMGPMTIGATVWRIDRSVDALCVSQRLEPEFQAKPLKRGSKHIPIGDSKKIHRDTFAKQGLMLGSRFLCDELEGMNTLDWESIFEWLAPLDWRRLSNLPWYALSQDSRDEAYELASIVPDLHDYFHNARAALRSLGVQLVGLRIRILDEPEFNRQVDVVGNKASVLSETSLRLVRNVIAEFAHPGEPVEVYCDKHGGRNRYHGVLSYCFDEAWIATEEEGQGMSCYSTVWQENALRIQFQVDGDSVFPTAAASVIAKWTRESLMERLNSYWCGKIPGGIEPTAGYYVDAIRFAKQIGPVAVGMKLDREKWWRKK